MKKNPNRRAKESEIPISVNYAEEMIRKLEHCKNGANVHAVDNMIQILKICIHNNHVSEKAINKAEALLKDKVKNYDRP